MTETTTAATEAARARVATPERGEVKIPKPSEQLVAQIATGDFRRNAPTQEIHNNVTGTNKEPTEVHEHAYKALNAHHVDQRRKDAEAVIDKEQQDYDRAADKTHLKDPRTMTTQDKYHLQMTKWANGENYLLQADLVKAQREGADAVDLFAKVMTDKLGFTITEGPNPQFTQTEATLYDYKNQKAGTFYTEFCTGDTNKKLAKLTPEEMYAVKGFLTRLLGSTDAFDALVALRQTQDRLGEQRPLSPAAGPMPNDGREQKILDFYQKGLDKANNKAQPRTAAQSSTQTGAPEESRQAGSQQQTLDKDKNRHPDAVRAASHDTTPQGPLTPEQQKVKDAEHEIFEMAGKRTAKEHMDLINEVVGDDTKGIRKEKKDGENKLGKTIQETAASPDGQRFIRDGAVAYIPSIPGEKVITIGDIHGDSITIKHLLEQDGFIENMESGNPTMRLVFLGDMVDRGPKSVEVMEIFMALKRRYGDRVQMIAADHDTTSNYVSSHDFPDKLRSHFGKGAGADVYGSYDQLFKALPKMVVTGDGDVMVHGGFPPLRNADLQKIARLDGDPIYGEAMSWGDPLDKAVDPKEQKAMTMREIAYASVMASVDQKKLGDDEYVSLTNLSDRYRAWAQYKGIAESPTDLFPNISENCSIKVKDLRKALQILQNLPKGVTLNMARAGSPHPIDAILAGLFAYDESSFNDFMSGVGGKVMVRGHQTSDDVSGGPSMFGGRLQTIHSTGGNATTGSAESAYKFRETDPKYVVLTLGKSRDTLQAGRDVKDVWGTTPTPAAQQPIRSAMPIAQPVTNYPAEVKIIRRYGPVTTNSFQQRILRQPKIHQPEIVRRWEPTTTR